MSMIYDTYLILAGIIMAACLVCHYVPFQETGLYIEYPIKSCYGVFFICDMWIGSVLMITLPKNT